MNDFANVSEQVCLYLIYSRASFPACAKPLAVLETFRMAPNAEGAAN